MPLKLALIVALAILAAAGLAAACGALRWRSSTRALRAALDAARVAASRPSRYHREELDGLPPPVARYFHAVLREGQPIVTAATMVQQGVFDLGRPAERWRRFTATQRVVTRRPGFDWDARIALLPGVPVRVHDAYVAGEGLLHASLFGLVPLARLRGTPELAEGELMRFLAEAAWYPTALLPSQGVRWEPVDERSAAATLADGDVRVTLTFHFADDGTIASVRGIRGRTVGTRIFPTPWEGRWAHYELHGGMRIPTEGEVAWHLPDGRRPYWRGRLVRIAYELAL